MAVIAIGVSGLGEMMKEAAAEDGDTARLLGQLYGTDNA